MPIDPVLQTLIAEAYGEGPEGMRLAAETIVNRSEQRGLTPAEVVQQRRQYSGYENPGPAVRPLFNDPSAVSAAQAAWDLARGPGDPTGGANHYFAPGTISTPSWARSMTPTLTSGGHAFYTDRPGYQQRGLGPVAPNPASITPSGAVVRQMTSPTNGNTALQTALDRVATRERNRVTPQTPAWLMTGMNQEPAPDLQTALNAYAQREAAKRTAPVQSGALSAAQRSAANRAALQMNQSYVGQDRTGGLVRPTVNPQPLPPNRQSGNPVNRNGIPVGPSRLPPLPPSTLPSVADRNRVTPMTPPWAMLGMNQQATQPSAFGGFPQGGRPPNVSSRNPVNLNGYPVAPPVPDRLLPSNPLPFSGAFPVMQSASMQAQRRGNFASIPNVGVANVPMPQPRPAVGTQMSVTPRVAPVPFQRPNFGMGGPGMAPVNAASMAMAGNMPIGTWNGNVLVPNPAQGISSAQIGQAFAQRQQPVPVARAPSVVNQFQSVGLSPAAAYAAANSYSQNGRTINGGQSWASADRTRDRDGGSSGLSSI